MDLYNTDYFKNWNNQDLNQNQNLKYNKSLSGWGAPLGDVPLAPSNIPPKKEIINEKYTPYDHYIPEIPKPGANWPGFGIPRAIAETGFRMKGGDYYSQKFPSREFNVGDQTYNQSGLGGYYHPDEVSNMQQFGGTGEGDPRVDQFGKNIVSFADDYEEGIEDWINKYGKRQSSDEKFKERQRLKNLQWNKILERRRGTQEKAQADAAARVGAERQAGAAANQMTQRREGRGGTHMSRSVGQGGLGISQAQAQQVSDANRAAGTGMGGWGLAEGGRIGYRNGEFVDEDVNIQGPNFDVNENVEMAEGKMPFDLRIEELMEKGMSYDDAYDIAAQEFQDLFAEGGENSFNQEGIASIV